MAYGFLAGGPDSGTIRRPKAFADAPAVRGFLAGGPDSPEPYQDPQSLINQRNQVQAEDVTGGRPLTIGSGILALANGVNKRLRTDQLTGQIGRQQAANAATNRDLAAAYSDMMPGETPVPKPAGFLAGGPTPQVPAAPAGQSPSIALSGMKVGIPPRGPIAGFFGGGPDTPPPPAQPSHGMVQAPPNTGDTAMVHQPDQTGDSMGDPVSAQNGFLGKQRNIAMILMKSPDPERQAKGVEMLQGLASQMSPTGQAMLRKQLEMAGLDVDAKHAEISKAQAEAEKTRYEIMAQKRQYDMMMQAMNGDLAGSAVGGAATPSAATPSAAVAQPVSGATSMPATAVPAPSYGNGVVGPAIPSAATALGAPGALDPTTRRAMLLDMATNGGKGMSAILKADPSLKQADAYAQKVGTDRGALLDKQRNGAALLGLMDTLEKEARADPSALAWSIGSNNNGFVVDHARDAISAATSGATTALSFGQGSWDPYKASANLKAQMDHLAQAISTTIRTGSPGGGSDAMQEGLLNMVGEMRNARDPATFWKIFADAKQALRAMHGLPQPQPQEADQPAGPDASAPHDPLGIR